jgi:hypothetical protein
MALIKSRAFFLVPGVFRWRVPGAILGAIEPG